MKISKETAVRIEQRRAQFTIILLCALAAVLGLAVALVSRNIPLIVASAISVIAYGGLAVASYYRQGWANLTTVVISTLLTSVALIGDAQTRGQFSAALFVPPVMALILAGPVAVAISGLFTLALPAIFVNLPDNPYTQSITLVVSLLVIAGMTVGRLVLDTMVQRSQEAEQAARAAQADAKREEALAQSRAGELEAQTLEQQRLIELIGTLELPVVSLAEGVVLLPILGHLDTRRMQAISTRLLNQIAEQRISTVILDLAGVSMIDTLVAQHIQQLIAAIGLLGAKVNLTGIRAEVAHAMANLGVDLRSVSIARTPQEVLSRRAGAQSLS
jgi:anti-anti-sigma regulatory factor